tara:strand:+ start:1335 stop:1502 length:168 start_codon:yes stop_codon:yes gene_type:complete
MKNSITGQSRVIRKKGDLTGAGKGDWLRVSLIDEQYKENYNKIFRKNKCSQHSMK